MSNAILYRMSSGIPGDISRKDMSTIESFQFSAPAPFGAYGVAAKVSGSNLVPFTGGETAASLYGFLVRPYPTNAGTDGLGVSTPPQSGGTGNVLRRGYISVKVNNGTAAQYGQVYIRVALNVAIPAGVIGGVEAVADGTNTVAIDAQFMCAADSNGNAEISYNI